jgi:hypothetical protein
VTSCDEPGYEDRIAAQIAQYRHVDHIHERSDMHRYWVTNYLRPRVQEVLGAPNHLEVYAGALAAAARRSDEARPRFLSLGSGDGDIEIGIAERLRRDGIRSFVIDAVDISQYQLNRAHERAAAAGLGEHLNPVLADLNHLELSAAYARQHRLG